MKKVILLVVLLVIPSLAYLYMKTGKNNFKSLEIFGPIEPIEKTVNGKTVIDTVYHSIGGFSLLDQDSNIVTQDIVKGKIHVANFFFTTCKTICPKMSNEMIRVQTAYKDDPDVKIISYTVNPEYDTPSILKKYANQHYAIKDKWYFLTGDKKVIYDLARSSYFLVASEGDGGPDDFIHSEMFVLIDKEGRIRGSLDKKGNVQTYDGTNILDVKRLIEDIDVLKREYAEKSN